MEMPLFVHFSQKQVVNFTKIKSKIFWLLTYDKFVLLKKGKIQDREMGKAKMGIVINHSENIFLLQTRSNSYAFGINDQGLVRHTEFLPWYHSGAGCGSAVPLRGCVLFGIRSCDEKTDQQGNFVLRGLRPGREDHEASDGAGDAGLAQKGLVELELIPGARNKKRILLTDAGRELEKNTTDRLRGAEIRAYGKLSVEELNSYLEMTRKLTAALREETEKL